MDRKIILGLFATLLFLSACSDGDKYRAEQSSIDSLVTALKKAKNEFEKAPYEEAEEAEKKARAQLSEIQKLVRDTLNRRAALLIGQYANITRKEEDEADAGKSDFAEKEIDYIIKELNFSISQLENLKHDLISGNMPAETFRKHLSNEQKAGDRIIRVAEMKRFRWKQIVELKDSLESDIVQLTDSLRNIKK
jgi:multidrug efflux pump subunit AcrA (membrane-fusion protein)